MGVSGLQRQQGLKETPILFIAFPTEKMQLEPFFRACQDTDFDSSIKPHEAADRDAQYAAAGWGGVLSSAGSREAGGSSSLA